MDNHPNQLTYERRGPMDASRTARTKEELVKDFRTSEILDAARHVIADLGYTEASMERIAQKAGLAKGTLYLYFENKESLLARAFEDGLQEIIGRARAATHRTRGAACKLREIVRTSLEHSTESQVLFQVIRERSTLESDTSALLRGALQQRVESYLRLVANVIERGARAGEFRRLDSQRAARFLMELVRGATLSRLHEPTPPSVDAEVETVVEFFLHGVGAGDSR